MSVVLKRNEFVFNWFMKLLSFNITNNNSERGSIVKKILNTPLLSLLGLILCYIIAIYSSPKFLAIHYGQIRY